MTEDILIFIFLEMASNQNDSSNSASSNHTFRLAFLRRKIRNTFQSPVLKAALLAELRDKGPDAELVVHMLEKVQAVRTVSVQHVQPMPNVQPTPAQPAPVVNRVDQANPPVVRDGSSEDTALEVLDSEDELVQDMALSSRREQRLRRQLQIWGERASSGTSSSIS